jgi:Holliday junction DNA helicase RuvA
MISRLWGEIQEVGPESVILRSGSVGYRVTLSPYALSRFSLPGESAMIRTFLLWSEHQETPTLIGFADEQEEALFHEIRRVGGLGATKAIRMISAPPETIWAAIAIGDIARLKQLKGVGETTAKKLISELKDRLPASLPIPSGGGPDGPFSSVRLSGPSALGDGLKEPGFVDSVREVLMAQFGHAPSEADRMIRRALARNPSVDTMENLFNEIYRHGLD